MNFKKSEEGYDSKDTQPTCKSCSNPYCLAKPKCHCPMQIIGLLKILIGAPTSDYTISVSQVIGSNNEPQTKSITIEGNLMEDGRKVKVIIKLFNNQKKSMIAEIIFCNFSSIFVRFAELGKEFFNALNDIVKKCRGMVFIPRNCITIDDTRIQYFYLGPLFTMVKGIYSNPDGKSLKIKTLNLFTKEAEAPEAEAPEAEASKEVEKTLLKYILETSAKGELTLYSQYLMYAIALKFSKTAAAVILVNIKKNEIYIIYIEKDMCCPGGYLFNPIIRSPHHEKFLPFLMNLGK